MTDPTPEPPEDVPEDPSEDPFEAEPGPEASEEEEEPRRYPSTIGGALYLLVLVATAVGIGVVTFGPWRTGLRVVAGALVAASLMRLALRDRDAGMLAVRNRTFDCVLLAALGGVLFVLASSIPDQPV